MNNEFLRPRENRCKWFNDFGVVRRAQYIGTRGKAKFLHKVNCMSRFTYYLNRFKPYKTKEKYDEEWNVSSDNWVDSNNPEDVWYDSKQVWIDSDHVRELDRFKQKWYDRSLNRFTIQVIRFIRSQRVPFLFQKLSEPIQTLFDTIHQSQRVEPTYLGHKEFKFWKETCETLWSRVLDLLGCFVQSKS